MLQILRGITWIMIFYLAGEAFTYFFALPIPGNVVGMVFLFGALQSKIIQSIDIEIVAIPLVALLNLFFVPAGVGILAYEQLLIENLPIILISSLISTLLVMWVAAKVFLIIKK